MCDALPIHLSVWSMALMMATSYSRGSHSITTSSQMNGQSHHFTHTYTHTHTHTHARVRCLSDTQFRDMLVSKLECLSGKGHSYTYVRVMMAPLFHLGCNAMAAMHYF